MSTPPNQRSIKISDDERGGWSSDRPRTGGGPPRPANLSVRCQVLRPSDAIRYSPGSLLVLVSASPEIRDRFAERVIEERGALLSRDRVRGLLSGRVPEEQIEERAGDLLLAAARKRFEAGETVVLAAEGLDPEAREPFVRAAAALRRPRHIVLLEAGRDQVADEDRAVLNALRRRLDAGQLGEEGFQTALRLGGDTIGEMKRIVFRPAPRDD
jgi:predicted kinase